MNFPTFRFDTKKPVALWALSDVHHGHVSHDSELFERHRAIAKAARAKVLFLGDALEAVTTGSKVANMGAAFDQTLSIGDQEDAFLDAMKGLRVLCTVEGNHEARVTRTTGTSPFKNINRLLAAQQGYPVPFLQHGGYVNIKVGSQSYRFHVGHGEGGPTTYFRYTMRDWPEADAWLAGHTHELGNWEHLVHRSGGPKRVTTCRTGSYLELPSYAAARPGTNMIPATGSYLIWLHPTVKHMRFEKMSDRELKAA